MKSRIYGGFVFAFAFVTVNVALWHCQRGNRNRKAISLPNEHQAMSFPHSRTRLNWMESPSLSLNEPLGPIHTNVKRMRKGKWSKNKQNRSKNKRQTSKKNFAFAFTFAFAPTERTFTPQDKKLWSEQHWDEIALKLSAQPSLMWEIISQSCAWFPATGAFMLHNRTPATRLRLLTSYRPLMWFAGR